jgi:predicted dehydrogenase
MSDMKKYKVLLVGCGEIGSRHLQAAAALNNIEEIHIVDSKIESLNLGKLRLKEIADLNKQIKFSWSQKFEKVSKNGDICIVATQASGRCKLIKQIAEELGYKHFLIEKLVSQSIGEYEDLLLFSEQHQLSIWVNCKTRAYAIHKYIKSRLDPKEPLILSRIGGNHGLASNGIHSADLFTFYDAATKIKSVASRIDSILHPSKRGKDIFDLSGTLHGFTDKGSEFILSFAPGHQSPDHILIVSAHGRFILDQFQKFVYESYPESDWTWKQVSVDEKWEISQMSKAFVFDILTKGTCDLPTLKECFPAHEFILSQLLPHFNRLMGVNHDFCSVT